MMLADMGAEVIRIERVPVRADAPAPRDPLLRQRRSVAIDIRKPAGVAVLLRLIERSAVLLEGFRPGVTERLGFGPAVCCARNPALVYGRMTGWGQDGPLAHAAGHDINYIALSGVLHLIGPPGGKPVPPLNLVGDFGGGGMLLLTGVLAALIEAGRSGHGQVVDAAMLDGAVTSLAMFFGFRAESYFRDETGENFLAGGAPFYDTYETRDGRYVAIGALESRFLALLLEKLGLDPGRFAGLDVESVADPGARQRWGELRAALTDTIRQRTSDEWRELLEGTDVCFAPVLSLEEAAGHPHNVARRTFIEVDGVLQNAPAPRFGRTPAGKPQAPHRVGEDTPTVLRDLGFSADELAQLRAAGAIAG
jgi:alpha-methylacyl-CoA racemase